MTKKISDLRKDYRNHKTFKIDDKKYWIKGIEYDYFHRTVTVEFIEVITCKTEEKGEGIWMKMKQEHMK